MGCRSAPLGLKDLACLEPRRGGATIARGNAPGGPDARRFGKTPADTSLDCLDPTGAAPALAPYTKSHPAKTEARHQTRRILRLGRPHRRPCPNACLLFL